MSETPKANPQKEIFDQFYDLTSVESATGLTGMTPALPRTRAELESYEEICGIPEKQTPQKLTET